MDEDEDLPGFNIEVGNEDDNENATKHKSKKKGGGFQSMGFCASVLKGIKNRGYKLPTPIQRKVSILMYFIYLYLNIIAETINHEFISEYPIST